MQKNGIELRVKGKVQGVGFRPFVWQLAQRLALQGEVYNDGQGVVIRLVATSAIETLRNMLSQEVPPLAHIESITSHSFHWPQPPQDFQIIASAGGAITATITPDAATCEECLQELQQTENRRYQYALINCTHCGPRFSLIRAMPYDRSHTAMAEFPLCPTCQHEYKSPANRRFHAQATTCSVCGPDVWLQTTTTVLTKRIAAIQQAAEYVLTGSILAIKGIGGFHLVCDATRSLTVQTLRKRKQRPTKPLAVMLPDIGWLKGFSQPDLQQLRTLLQSPAAPIVLIEARKIASLCADIAPGLDEIGVMLPANPLQHLLIQQVQRPLVMTSGNGSGKAPVLDNQDAIDHLATIADYWLLHNRQIVQRVDDSVVRFRQPVFEMLRRSRGYVPDSVMLPPGFEQTPSVLALGADLKNTFCLLQNGQAMVSQHFGDLIDVEIQQQVENSLQLFQQIYQMSPEHIAVDTHPGYISHQLGQKIATEQQLPLHAVLHHHAHIAACLAEHNWPRDGGQVIGLALDGLGYGVDGQLWGGECLLADYRECQWLGGLPTMALPGGDRAAQQPWRNLLAYLLQYIPNWQCLPVASVITRQAGWQQVAMMIEKQLNTPLASSCGRLFDAVAAALDLNADQISWEGEAACRLEALARQAKCHSLLCHIELPAEHRRFDLTTFWQQWLVYQASPADKALAFHRSLADGLARMVRYYAERYQRQTVVLSGGVIHNRLLRELLIHNLMEFTVLTPSQFPAGDGGIALGQALITAAKI